MKNKIVKIYCLYNPQTLKIRYVGRTICKLNKRLTEHISKAKYDKKYNLKENGSYKNNWINSLLKNGIRPKIKLLTQIEGWQESHVFEKKLIQKHLLKHNLVNGDDRGPGNFAKNINIDNEIQRIKKIKEYFNKEENKLNFYNKIYVYNLKGQLIDEYKSVLFAAKELNINRNKIIGHMSFKNPSRQLSMNINGLYFDHNKYEIYPFTRSVDIQNHKIIYVDGVKFKNFLELSKKYNFTSWDINELGRFRFTKRVKETFKSKYVKITKKEIAVLERNF